MSEKYIYKKRTFLNSDASMTGFIIACVPDFERDKEGKIENGVYPTLTIADCSERISLDFSFYTKSEIKSVRKKMKLFRETVNEFMDALEKQLTEFEKSKC